MYSSKQIKLINFFKVLTDTFENKTDLVVMFPLEFYYAMHLYIITKDLPFEFCVSSLCTTFVFQSLVSELPTLKT